MKVLKTLKMYVNGAFLRSESGRTFAVHHYGSKKVYANVCRATRKDLRGAVEAALTGLNEWMGRSGYDRGQIVYRLAEMLEAKRPEIHEILIQIYGLSSDEATREIDLGIEAVVYFAGFSDKYSQLLAAINPVASSHHCFTVCEPVGVVGVLPACDFSQLIAHIVSVVCSGNTVVACFTPQSSVLATPLGEALATSDFPNGVINLLTGYHDELLTHLAGHMEVNAITHAALAESQIGEIRELGTDNMKRVVEWTPESSCSLIPIHQTIEYKTAWHPIGK